MYSVHSGIFVFEKACFCVNFLRDKNRVRLKDEHSPHVHMKSEGRDDLRSVHRFTLGRIPCNLDSISGLCKLHASTFEDPSQRAKLVSDIFSASICVPAVHLIEILDCKF